jgi:proliferating cell nuclear antigen
MEIKIEKTRFLMFLDSILAIAPECRMWLNEDGIEVRTTDTGNIAMVNAKIPTSAFYGYEKSSDPIGLDLKKLKTACAFMMNGELMFTWGKKGKIHITDGGRYDYEYLPLDPNTIRKDPNPPEMFLPSSIIIDGKEFQESIAAMSKIGDKIKLCLEDKIFTMKTPGDTDSLTGEIPCEVVAPVKKRASSTFSLDYLQDVGKVLGKAEGVTVSFATDHPIKIACTVDQIALEYLIAPRIEDDAETETEDKKET